MRLKHVKGAEEYIASSKHVIQNFKEHLKRGKSYEVKVQKLSLYDKVKGVELDD